jgi:hypothetical protein
MAGGVFCFLFFPWPLWIVLWGLFAIIGLVQILDPTRNDTRPQNSRPSSEGDFSDFDDQIKWDKFAALDQADENRSWAKAPTKAGCSKKEENNKDKPL